MPTFVRSLQFPQVISITAGGAGWMTKWRPGYRSEALCRGGRVTDKLLDLFLSTTEDYGIILLEPDGRVRQWSRGAERLFGFQPHEVEGTLAHEIFVPPDRQAGVPEVELQVAKEQGRAEDERWHMRKDGSRFWASGVMVSLR